MGRCQHLRMGWHGGKTASYRKRLDCGQRFEKYERTVNSSDTLVVEVQPVLVDDSSLSMEDAGHSLIFDSGCRRSVAGEGWHEN
eukprot:2431246-Alexandrium_andersonii.AAC.1